MYGTWQMFWKHRDVIFRPKYGALGFVALPLALMGLGFTAIAPAIDLGALWGVANHLIEVNQLSRDTTLTPGEILLSAFWTSAGPTAVTIYTSFIVLETFQSMLAFWMDRERPWPLLWVPVQRFVMRWLLYYVTFVTVIEVLKGVRVGWGKLQRSGSTLGAGG
jgi:hypothetical protein